MIGYIQYPRLLHQDTAPRYTWDGQPKPSVTEILSSVARLKGDEWIPIADNRFAHDEIARNFGNALHKCGALYWKEGEDFERPAAIEPWFKQFLLWRREFSFLRVCTDGTTPFAGNKLIEYPMYNPILGYCGTPDLIAQTDDTAPRPFNNAILVVDYKTSVKEMDYWKYQVAAYTELHKVIFRPKKPYVTMAVQLSETDFKVHVRVGKEIYLDWNIFISAYNLFRG